MTIWDEQKMLAHLRSLFAFLMLVAALVSACATTQLDSTWKDPLYQDRPHKIMVIGIAKSQINRRIFEDEFIRQLNAHGMVATASYTVLPERQENDNSVVAAKLAQVGADTVLITRMVSKETRKFYVPGTPYYPPPDYGTWQDYYRHGQKAMYMTPGHMSEEEFAVIETNLYEAANEKLIWSSSSETGMSGANQDLIKSYIGVMVNTMVEQGLLGK